MSADVVEDGRDPSVETWRLVCKASAHGVAHYVVTPQGQGESPLITPVDQDEEDVA